jgi:N6-adenosine-specific RNA methylase IME4
MPSDLADCPSLPTFRRAETVDSLAPLVAAGRRFGCIYADPPWRYGNQATRGAAGKHYPTMTVEEIAALPVGALAAPQSHLHLWTTNGFLFEAIELIRAWGFQFEDCFVWVKPQMGLGNYWRNAHEYLLLGVRGGLAARSNDVKSWGPFPRTRHSAKPERIRTGVVEAISPGPYLELFGRRTVPGWTVFGNQVEPEPLFAGE